MIHLVTGNKNQSRAYIHNLATQQGLDISKAYNLYDNDFAQGSFQEIVPVHTGLFGERELYVIHNSVRNLDIKNILKQYAESDHVIVFREDSVLKKDLIQFQKIDAHVEQFEKEQKPEVKKYNTFALADLLGARDKKNLWLGYRQAITQTSAEEIHGILFWQVKNLALVKTSNTNPGMNNFVFSKNQQFAKKYTLAEIQALAERLTYMFHTRDTYRTLEIDLEQFILEL
ncbi:MAG: hypothetical protein ACPGTS_01650 [Minisyncoccia bacterium]